MNFEKGMSHLITIGKLALLWIVLDIKGGKEDGKGIF